MASSVIGQLITVQAENKNLRYTAALYSVLDSNFNAFLRNVYLLVFIVFTAAAEYSVSTPIYFLIYIYIYIQGVPRVKVTVSGECSLC